jgi:secreted protein with Ig-like and vWFA domain
MTQLQFDLQRVSELLYDWTDGQAALGAINIYHDKLHWDSADIRIYASNHLRPNAGQGGITKADQTDPGGSAVYEPGRVRIGATWNR